MALRDYLNFDQLEYFFDKCKDFFAKSEHEHTMSEITDIGNIVLGCCQSEADMGINTVTALQDKAVTEAVEDVLNEQY